MQIRERHRLVKFQMATAAHLPGSSTGDHNRQIQMVMQVWISHAAAVQIQHMIKERPASFRDLFELLQKICKQ